jgi:hypothetical protein
VTLIQASMESKMKRLLLLILVCISYLNAIEIDEYKTDIYFANGILTDEGNVRLKVLFDAFSRDVSYDALRLYVLFLPK